MAQVFTDSFVQNRQSNLSTNLAPSINSSFLLPPIEVQKHYFQLLIFNELQDQPQLVYGTLENLEKKYQINPEIFLSPHLNKTIDPEFCPLDLENVNEWNNIYSLYQTRKLSQMIAHTWLNLQEDDPIKKKVDFVKKIFEFPSFQFEIYWLSQSEEDPQKIEEIELAKKLLEYDQSLNTWLIKPEHINYDKIALALLLCGQAFYKDGNDELKQIWEPIGSIYEVINVYAIDVSWDIFHGVIQETSNIGGKQKFPANQITIPYPPRPSEFNLSQSKIETWATAKDYKTADDPNSETQAQDNYSFYPQKNVDDSEEYTDDWKNKKLNRVSPPFPYIPLSSF